MRPPGVSLLRPVPQDPAGPRASAAAELGREIAERFDLVLDSELIRRPEALVETLVGRWLRQFDRRAVVPAAPALDDAVRDQTIAGLALELGAVRFASLWDFSLERDTEAAVRRLAATIRRVSAERIREELRSGNTPQASIRAGYDKAFSTIADANITTLIAAFVLFLFGTGPVKGFAVTLSLGIVTSMFTAIVGTRAVVNLIYGARRVKRLAI